MIIEECITGHESMRNILNSTWGLKEAGIFLDTACLPLSSWMCHSSPNPPNFKNPWRQDDIYIPFTVLNTQLMFEVMELID